MADVAAASRPDAQHDWGNADAWLPETMRASPLTDVLSEAGELMPGTHSCIDLGEGQRRTSQHVLLAAVGAAVLGVPNRASDNPGAHHRPIGLQYLHEWSY